MGRHRTSPATALVTGASSGIGMQTVIQLAVAGTRVAACMRDLDASRALTAAAFAAGVDTGRLIRCLRMDVTSQQQITEAVCRAEDWLGEGIELLVNNAGQAIGGYLEDVPPALWREQLETNVVAVAAVTQAVLPGMRTRSGGKILNVGSISGRIGFPGFGPYAASKFALEGLSESLRHELRPFGIHVVLLEAGAYRTGIWSKGMAAASAPRHSAYREQFGQILAYVRRSAEAAPEAEEAAKHIVHIASLKHPRLRYPIGPGVKLTLLGKALLPWRIFEAVVARRLYR
ncbi:SDR family NAD(P)-dependent oxidoreductase [Paenibacillus tarimensis]|uniref:SDR family NAD(P)-dependent oxidoreductase n=1 Tax=Paenibacillus tarimensis TaxID=416012 RepID=UPI001F27B3F0|nr:SDR family NAD(P)-dependent oxidoreductase [Paenibacillus tarimensis]MCF2943627.1 SDR family NAD(P)-dependent oxidoreductase [Paenibacillus tarimensis]